MRRPFWTSPDCKRFEHPAVCAAALGQLELKQ